MLKTFKIILAYDGTNYFGWQKQIEHVTIEGEIIKACKKLFTNEALVLGSSRTDSGVHALGQVVAIKVDTNIPVRKIAHALNAHLPEDIVVQSAEEVEEGFHPRYYAVEKTYVYRIYNAKMPLPQHMRYSAHFYEPLDLQLMRQACSYFIGTHDFFAFSSAGGSVKTSIRTIYQCSMDELNGLIEITMRGDGFLYNMVRIIVGTLIDVGTKKIRAEDIPAIFESRDRLKSGKKAPAQGLTLVEIKY